MTLATKRRLVQGALALFTAWPVVHLRLVARYDLDPWKLGGWGMYAAPRLPSLGMEVYGRAAATDAWVQLTTPSAPLRATAEAFLHRYVWLRKLARPDALARAVRAERADFRALRVIVFQPVLDAPSGMIVQRDVTFEYPEGVTHAVAP